MGAPKVGESGNIIRIDAGQSIAGNTDLEMVFTKPDGITIITKTSLDGVVVGTVNVTDPDTGIEFIANEYWEYPTEVGLIDVVGTWNVFGVFINSATSPVTELCGDASATDFVVVACGPTGSD